MNYIKQLQNTVKEQKREITALRQGFQDLRIYLSLPKFAVDTYVNKNDIFLRIEESLTAANCANDLPEGNEEGEERMYRNSYDSACHY